MTTDDILRMAREAGIANVYMTPGFTEVFERFAALVAAEVHRACEKERKDEMIDEAQCNDDVAYNAGCLDCAAAIRARGTK